MNADDADDHGMPRMRAKPRVETENAILIFRLSLYPRHSVIIRVHPR